MQTAKSSKTIYATLPVIFVLTVAVALIAVGQDKPKTDAAPYVRSSAPGVGQKFLEKFAGDWDVEKRLHARDGSTNITKGECHQAMINNGLFLKSDFILHTGTTNMTGVGIIGFEPASGLFTSTWVDSGSTKMTVRRGKDPFDGSKIVMFTQTLGDPVREGHASRNETHLEDNGRKIVHCQYSTPSGGEERLTFELILTKKDR